MKKICLSFLLLLAVATIVACSASQTSPDETVTTVPSGTEPLTDAVTDETMKNPIVSDDGTPITDTALHGWFDYGSVTYFRDYNKFSVKQRDSIALSMAKNEIEGFQYLLAANQNYDDLRVEVSTLSDGKGNSLSGTVYLAYNINIRKVEGNAKIGFCPEPILPLDDDFVGGTFDVIAGRSKTVYVKYVTDINTIPGVYTGRLEVKQGGRILLSGEVSVTVWDLYYDEETASKNGFGIGYWPEDTYMSGPPSAPATIAEGKYINSIMKPYCDFLLENRISVATLPLDGGLFDEHAADYLNNPRLSFLTTFTDQGFTPSNLTAMYEVASAHEGWLDKLVFGYFDEPHKEEHVQLVIQAAREQQPYFPTTNYMTCSLGDIPLGDKDLAERYAEFSTFHCFKDQLFLTPIRDTLMKLKEERGDTVLWYTCGGSLPNMINLQGGVDSTLKRVYSWQQYLYNVDGMLYYNTIRWQSLDIYEIWDPGYDDMKFKPVNGTSGPTCDGVLIYWHPVTKMPISGLGMEAVRDGIEDYQLLSMAEEVLGRETVLTYVTRITTSLTDFTDDADLVNQIKNELAEALMATTKP